MKSLFDPDVCKYCDCDIVTPEQQKFFDDLRHCGSQECHLEYLHEITDPHRVVKDVIAKMESNFNDPDFDPYKEIRERNEANTN